MRFALREPAANAFGLHLHERRRLLRGQQFGGEAANRTARRCGPPDETLALEAHDFDSSLSYDSHRGAIIWLQIFQIGVVSGSRLYAKATRSPEITLKYLCESARNEVL